MKKPEDEMKNLETAAEDSSLEDVLTELVVVYDGMKDGSFSDEPDMRSLKVELLTNGKKAAAAAWGAFQNGVTDEWVSAGFERIIHAAVGKYTKDALKSALRESELLLKHCRELQEASESKKKHECYMREALCQARKAKELGEVPIGCVIVRDGKVIGRGYNRRTADRNVLAHAEMIAINEACSEVGDWRLEDCTLYVTLEPCPMCAGAMVQSRLHTCVIGSMSDKSGCAGSVVNLLQEKGFNHRVNVVSGVLQEECSSVLSVFFEEMRQKSRP